MGRIIDYFKAKLLSIKDFFSYVFSCKCFPLKGNHKVFVDDFPNENEKTFSISTSNAHFDPLSMCWQIIENAECSLKIIQDEIEDLTEKYNKLYDKHDPLKSLEYNSKLLEKRNKVTENYFIKKEELLNYFQAKNFAIIVVSKYYESSKKPSVRRIESTLKKFIPKKYRYKIKYMIDSDIVEKQREGKLLGIVSKSKTNTEDNYTHCENIPCEKPTPYVEDINNIVKVNNEVDL